MAWAAITEADILTVMAGPELEAIRAAALKAGQADPVAPTITDVTDLVRGYVAVRNTLGPDGTIPSKLQTSALDIIASRIPQRVNHDPSEGRKTKEKEAIRLLERVADGKFRVEEPTTASEESTGSIAPVISASTRKFTRATQDGI